jgi:hypothetical protein
LNSVVCHDCGNGLESYRWSDGANNSVVGGQSPCNDASWVRANNFNNSNYDTCCCSVCSGYDAVNHPQERYSGEYDASNGVSSSRCSNWQIVSTSVYPATSGFTAAQVIAWAQGIFDSWISSNGYNECCYCYGVDKISTSLTGTTYDIYACPTGNDGCYEEDTEGTTTTTTAEPYYWSAFKECNVPGSTGEFFNGSLSDAQIQTASNNSEIIVATQGSSTKYFEPPFSKIYNTCGSLCYDAQSTLTSCPSSTTTSTTTAPTADCTSDGVSGGPVEAWDNETTYDATSGTDAVVCYNGLAYRCVQSHNEEAEPSGAVTPGTDTNYWVRVSSYDHCCT